jgi:hypothetical protein
VESKYDVKEKREGGEGKGIEEIGEVLSFSIPIYNNTLLDHLKYFDEGNDSCCKSFEIRNSRNNIKMGYEKLKSYY